MSICVSKRRLRFETALAFLLVSVAAAVFYLIQNRRLAAGGEIALPKLCWLAYAILYWYILPALIVRDHQAQVATRRLYAIFFANMAVRGALELPMIYYWRNWHPYYGAVHDGFSILLMAHLARQVYAKTAVDRLLKRNAAALAAMLGAEIGFALYFAANFHTQGPQAVYYVPDRGAYSGILMFTATAVVLLTIYLGYFTREWLYGPDES